MFCDGKSQTRCLKWLGIVVFTDDQYALCPTLTTSENMTSLQIIQNSLLKVAEGTGFSFISTHFTIIILCHINNNNNNFIIILTLLIFFQGSVCCWESPCGRSTDSEGEFNRCVGIPPCSVRDCYADWLWLETMSDCY